MTKSNRMLVGILVFIVTVVVGYALFSENVKVSGTLNAQGSFRSSYTCSAGIDNTLFDYLNIGAYVEGGYRNDQCSVNGNVISVNVGLDYPTAGRWFTIKITNTGNIPAKFYIDRLSEKIDACITTDGVEECGTSDKADNETGFDYVKSYYYYAIPVLQTKEGQYSYYDIDKSPDLYDSKEHAYKVDIGDSVVILFYQYWNRLNPAYGEGTNYGDYTITSTLKFNLVQETN